MKPVISNNCPVYFSQDGYTNLNSFLDSYSPSKVVVLVDSNTKRFCLEDFCSKIDTSFSSDVIELAPGEEHKTIEGCLPVWEKLSEIGADRKSVLVNLGGGVVTDLGGFIASTYKRGIKYINVPTSLLSMVDASIGGKTGVDLGPIKNQIGVINSGEMVIVDIAYLNTLPNEQFYSGAAEMLKHGLIFDESYWEELKNLERESISNIEELIYRSIEIKNEIVEIDPSEKNLRKILNFGHTLGHAIESFYLENTEYRTLLHGEAIAVGMILESYISTKLLGLPPSDYEDIFYTMKRIYPLLEIPVEAQEDIIELLKYDKKNEGGRINFVLIEKIGKAKIDCQVENNLIKEAFLYYNERL